MNKPNSIDAGCASSLYRALFIPLLFFIIALPRLLDRSAETNRGWDGAMFWLIFGLLFVIPLLFAAVGVFRLLSRSEASDTQNSFIAPASIVWLLPNILGWIIVREGEQVGVIGQRIYERSGFFMHWPLNPVRMNTLSTQQIPKEINISGRTFDKSKVTMTAKVKYQVVPNAVADILRNNYKPDEAFHQDLEAAFSSFISSNTYSSLHSPLTYDGLFDHLQRRLPQYHIIVNDVRIGGERVELESTLAAEAERIAEATAQARIDEIKRRPALMADIMKDMINTASSAALAAGIDPTPVIQQVLRLVSSEEAYKHSEELTVFPNDNDVAPKPAKLLFVEGGSIRHYITPPLQLLSEQPPKYFLECYGYKVSIDTTQSTQRPQITIHDVNNECIFSDSTPLINSTNFTNGVLAFIVKKVEEDISDNSSS